MRKVKLIGIILSLIIIAGIFVVVKLPSLWGNKESAIEASNDLQIDDISAAANDTQATIGVSEKATIEPTEVPADTSEDSKITPTEVPTVTATKVVTDKPSPTPKPTVITPKVTTKATASPTKLAPVKPKVTVPTAKPTPKATVPPKPPSGTTNTPSVTLIGDSVMLGAVSNLQKMIPNCYVDAKQSRQVNSATSIIKYIESKKKLGSKVVISLGTNGPFTQSTGQKVIDCLGKNRRIYWVNVYGKELSWADKSNNSIKAIASANKNVTVINWHDLAKNHSDWTYNDGIHLNGKGREQFAKLIRDSIK